MAPVVYYHHLWLALDLILKSLLVFILILAIRGLAWLVNLFVIAPRSDPLKNLPGPDGSAFQSHFSDIMDPEVSPENHESWTRSFGKTMRFQGFGRHDYRLLTLDFKAITHILNSPAYEKPWQTRTILTKLLGRGVFAMEGDEHKLQRRVITPAFTTQAIKAMMPVFLQKAEELRECWEREVDAPHPSPLTAFFASLVPSHMQLPHMEKKSQAQVIEISHWLIRATFDVIGLAGFDYDFHSLKNETESVYRAYRQMFSLQEEGPGYGAILRLYFPILDKFWPDRSTQVTQESLKTIHTAGRKIIESKRKAILAEKTDVKSMQDKDLLSLLIKSNLSADPSKRLSDADLLDQLSTFLFAGSDTTALAMTWALHHLASNTDVQAKLREELLSMRLSPNDANGSESAYADMLDAMPYLDAVVREVLRLSPPLHSTIRVATEDGVIPLSAPLRMRDGSWESEIAVRKGSYVHIPIEGLNQAEAVWGPDAKQFRPERWLAAPSPSSPASSYVRAPPVQHHPGLAGMMTFSLGPHSCPGYKFAILETKVFLAELLPYFVFRPTEGVEVHKVNSIVTRPYVKSRLQEGPQMPVSVERYCHV